MDHKTLERDALQPGFVRHWRSRGASCGFATRIWWHLRMGGEKSVQAKKRKSEPKVELTTDELRSEIVAILLQEARKGGTAGVRAVDLLGSLRENSWFARPADPIAQPPVLDEKTIQVLLALPDECPRCGYRMDASSHPLK